MQCPYNLEVGDPPDRVRCPRNFVDEDLTQGNKAAPECYCEADYAAATGGDEDPQSTYVLNWWLEREQEQRVAAAAASRTARPTIQMP